MKLTTRQRLLGNLLERSGAGIADLMDWLQLRGLVSDCAIDLRDVPTGDLAAALVRLMLG